MLNPLPANVVKQVVREILQAKSPHLDKLLDAVVAAILPRVTEDATLWLLCCWEQDPRERIIDGLVKQLNDVIISLDMLQDYGDTQNVHEMAIAECARLIPRLVASVQWLELRRRSLRGESLPTTSPSDEDVAAGPF